MKKLVLSLLLFLVFLSCRNQVETEEENYIYQAVIDVLSQVHYLQINRNEDFYNKTLNNYFDLIDRSKVFISKLDREKIAEFSNPNSVDTTDSLVAYRETIGKIPEMTYNIYQTKIGKYREAALDVLEAPIDFNRNDTFETDIEKKKVSETDELALSEWKKSLRYDVMSRLLLATDVTNQEKIVYLSPEYKEQEEKARLNTLKATKIFLLTFETMKPRDFFNIYLKGLGKSYDQYTTYQSPVEEETFNINISGELEGIGAQIGKGEDGSVSVSAVIPGGPAYKQKALESGDKILKVGQGDHDEMVDLIPLTLNEGLTHIRGKKGTKVRLEVKRVNGTVEIVNIIRGKVVLAETYVQSALVDTVKGKYGYILVPKFYGNLGGSGDRSVSEDTRLALDYFNRKNVKGLIIDLRNNTGGFLGDAIKMSRYFVGDGPVVRVKSRWEEEALSDTSGSEILFDKPVVVMINENSASASEIFSAALQDYGRAVIVGSKQSFGKATVQRVYPLVEHYYLKGYGKSFGSLKFTIQKYYRVTGKSTQTKGVRSDIVYPGLSLNARNKKHSFPIDALSTMKLKKWDKYELDIDTLVKRSERRLNDNEYFINIKERRKLIDKHLERSLYSLNYQEERDKRDFYLKQLEDFKQKPAKPSLYFDVKLNSEEHKRLDKSDKSEEYLDVQKATREEWVKNLKIDHYLEETIFVLEDILSII